MKKCLLIFFLLWFAKSNAQDFNEWNITQEEMDMKYYIKDSSANAVVLQEFGDARLTESGPARLTFKYHVKIKIFKSSGFKNGNITIPIYSENYDTGEEVNEVEGVTYYKDDAGIIITQKIEPSAIIKEKKSTHWFLLKIAMPNLREGSVIEYKYELRTPYYFTLKKWAYQSDIPKISSDYVVHIPSRYQYNISLTGYLKLTKSESTIEKGCSSPLYRKTGSTTMYYADCSKLRYLMTDVPAFIEEENMTSPENYKSAINFELANFVDFRGNIKKVTADWADVEKLLHKSEYFGSQLKKKDLLKKELFSILDAQNDRLILAKEIVDYVKRSFKWNGVNEKYSENIKKAFESHTGSSADINLFLINALNEAGFKTDPVILSTRDNGLVHRLYPTVSDFNYVIAKLELAGKIYMLDATEPLLPFGLLPLRCINDQGRVVGFNKASYWIDLVASQKETKFYTADLTLLDNGKISGTITKVYSGYEAFKKRKSIKEFNSTEEYIENLDENWLKTKILSSEISNLDSLDKPLTEMFTIEVDPINNLQKDKYSFDPFFLNRMINNPFTLEERAYPVDLGAIQDSRVIISLTLPKNFKTTNQPPNSTLLLPNKGGKFLSTTMIEGNNVTYSQIKQFNKSIYTPEEYPALKELTNRIVQLQKTDIIFQKSE